MIKKISKKIFKLINAELLNHRKKQINKQIKTSPFVQIEIGSGEKIGENGWLTLDFIGTDINWDLRNGMPFDNDTIDEIYSSHLFEHLTFNEASVLFDECKRVLKPHGVFSICVPNSKRYIDAYFNKDQDFWKNEQPDFLINAYNKTTLIDYINYIAYMDGHHKYMFDEENLVYILISHGFKNVKVRDFDINIDMLDRDFESIYAIANK
jgi:predicted SAM-dependent methyltransferase